MEKQVAAYDEQLKAKESLISQLQDVIKEEPILSNSRLEALSLRDAKFKTVEQKLSYLNSSQSENSKKYEELLNCKKDLQDKLRDAEKICIKNATECIQYNFLYENCEKY